MKVSMNSVLTRVGLSVLMSAKALLSPVVLGVCAIAQDRDGRILLVKHTYQPGWLFPGGGVGRGEPPEHALDRELKEEVGLIRGSAPEFVQLYTRRAGWATNVVALYRLRDVEIDFKANWEIKEARFFAPDSLPSGTPSTVRRRIGETLGGAPPSPFW
jgi:ADP-ribose pyrophosphatase YjhB (NUDIX family)